MRTRCTPELTRTRCTPVLTSPHLPKMESQAGGLVHLHKSATMSVQSLLSARQKDGKRIGVLKTGDKTLRNMLSPLQCAILSIPAEYGLALPGMVELLRQWNLYTNTRVRKYYDDYKHLKDVLHRPRQGSLEELKKT